MRRLLAHDLEGVGADDLRDRGDEIVLAAHGAQQLARRVVRRAPLALDEIEEHVDAAPELAEPLRRVGPPLVAVRRLVPLVDLVRDEQARDVAELDRVAVGLEVDERTLLSIQLLQPLFKWL